MSVELSFRPDQESLRRVRGEAREAAARLGAPQRACDTIAIVVDEVVNNAIEHGAAYRKRGLELSIRISAGSAGFLVEFFDREMPNSAIRELANALEQASKGAPSLENERGRGLFLLSVYLEDLMVGVDSDGGMCLRGLVLRSTD